MRQRVGVVVTSLTMEDVDDNILVAESVDNKTAMTAKWMMMVMSCDDRSNTCHGRFVPTSEANACVMTCLFCEKTNW